MTNIPKTLLDAVRYFSDLEVCEKYMREIRWAGNPPVCVHCGGMRIGEVKTRHLMRCKDCRRQFSSRHGTILVDSPLRLGVWFVVIFCEANEIKVSCKTLRGLLGIGLGSARRLKKNIKTAGEIANAQTARVE